MSMQIDVLQLLRSNRPRDVDRGISVILKSIQGSISAWVLSNGGTQEDAEDCTQEAITSFYSRLMNDPDLEVDNVDSYVFGSARYIWLNKKKKNNRLPQTDLGDYQIADDQFEGLQEDQLEVIMEAMESISESCRKLLVLFYFEKKNMTEIASLLEYKGIDSVKTKKYKCLSALRSLVTDKWKKGNG